MGDTVEFEAITISDIRQFLASHPQVKSKTIIPFTTAEIRAMLAAAVKTSCTYSDRVVKFKLVNAARNKAIVMLLLDTGIRAGELCDAKIKDCDLGLAHQGIREGTQGENCRVLAHHR